MESDVQKYSGRDQVFHYFGNHVGIARIWHNEGFEKTPADYKNLQEKFVSGMKRVYGEPDKYDFKPPFTEATCRQFEQRALSGEWENLETVLFLYSDFLTLRAQEEGVPEDRLESTVATRMAELFPQINT